MTHIGTAWFVSKEKAAMYYRDYEGGDGFATVNAKLLAGEIHIGKPTLKKGEKLLVIDNGTRYAIEEAPAKNLTAKQQEKLIEQVYYKTCSGIQIDIMDISKVFARGREILEHCPGDTVTLGKGLRAYVELLRKN